MPRKPQNIKYSVDDKPPKLTTIFLGLQHVFIYFIAIMFPVMIVSLLGNKISAHDARAFVSLSMLCGGVVTILQAWKKVGSGYFCPSVCGPSYMSATIIATSIGSLPLIMGMNAAVGILEITISRFLRKLRFLFPTEVTGIIVMLVGVVIVPMAVKHFFLYDVPDPQVRAKALVVGVSTLRRGRAQPAAVPGGAGAGPRGRLRDWRSA